MFRERTTIVVGAGASCELGLPSGDTLKDQIIQLLAPSSDNVYGFSSSVMQEAMRIRAGPNIHTVMQTLQPLKMAAERIRRGLPLAMSIDNFLHSHQGDVEVEQLGKLAIAICILHAERRSHLFSRVPAMLLLLDNPPDAHASSHGEDLQKTWYPAFARQLMSQVQRNDIARAFENVRFVIFNYDRCLEQYLWMALQDYFDISEEEATEVLDGVEFSHPYGSLGMLPWRTDATTSIGLGASNTPDLWKVGARLRTFTESVRSKVGEKVQAAISEAKTILILGFGYLDQNLQLLRPGNGGAQRVISTAYGVSGVDQRVMQKAMLSLSAGSPETFIEEGACRDLFDHYRLMLSLPL